MALTTTARRTALLLSSGLVALGAVACTPAESGVSTDAKPSAATSDKAAGAATDKAAEAPKQAAKIGDTIGLKGFDKAETADVAAVKIVDPAEPGDEFFKPADGKRWVAVQFRIKPTGSKAYSDAPFNSAKVVDAEGQAYGTTLAETKAGKSFEGSTNIAPNETGLGFVTFEVPKEAKIDKVQFTLDSGMAPQTGQWKLS
ncbi:DUF4352 domain-containing protein [Kitasatospora sp. NPDC096147]|uniref:DUF4352 domain-containing protein n=1 Tax=Kitasatospora sp. NPDC096147 TaxID=3364093 RepID=UPI00380ABB49